MRQAWLALVDERPDDATASARVSGDAEGWLAVWDRPVRHALRADPAAFDPHGPAASASYVLADRDVLFDDQAVQRARQRLLAGGSWTAITTLVNDPSHFRGSLLAGPAPAEDPFAAVAPARRLTVDFGLISAGPVRLPGPVIERYAGRPWPQQGFA